MVIRLQSDKEQAAKEVQLNKFGNGVAAADHIDLTDAVAEALNECFSARSLVTVYRCVYFFTQAHYRVEATDVFGFLAAHAKR